MPAPIPTLEELQTRAAQRSERLAVPSVDVALERFRTAAVGFFDRVPEPPLYHRTDDPDRATALGLLVEAEELLATQHALGRAGGQVPGELALALVAHVEVLRAEAGGEVEASERAWTRARELARSAVSAHRLWFNTGHEPPPVFDRATGVSRFDPRPQATVRARLVCPTPGCQEVSDYAFSPVGPEVSLVCPKCRRRFTAFVGEVREAKVEPIGSRRRFVFRVEDLGGQLSKVEFEHTGPAELSVARRDLVAFLYTSRRELAGVLNLSTSRVLWVSRGGPCFLATVAFGEEARELEAFRAFRDRVLLPSPVGARLVGLYYRLGPRAADMVSAHPNLRRAIRLLLWGVHRWLSRRSA